MIVHFGKLSFIFVSIFPYDAPADPINKDELKPEHARRSSSFVFRSRSLFWLVEEGLTQGLLDECKAKRSKKGKKIDKWSVFM